MADVTYKQISDLVLSELHVSLGAIKEEEVEKLIDIVLNSRKVFFIGVGRVMLSLQAMAKRWNHLGIDCHLVGEITEPAITPDDVLIVGSGSGTTLFPAGTAQKAQSHNQYFLIYINNHSFSPLRPNGRKEVSHPNMCETSLLFRQRGFVRHRSIQRNHHSVRGCFLTCR